MPRGAWLCCELASSLHSSRLTLLCVLSDIQVLLAVWFALKHVTLRLASSSPAAVQSLGRAPLIRIVAPLWVARALSMSPNGERAATKRSSRMLSCCCACFCEGTVPTLLHCNFNAA